MMGRPLLSICIPTFNREGFLRECLDSIQVDSLQDQIEVVVSDNASTDKTVELLESFRDRLPLRWVVQDANIGPDRNFDAVVALAEGEYCWLLGSDDVIEPDAVARMLVLLKAQGTDILHFGYVQTDIALKRLYSAHPPAGKVGPTPQALADYLCGMANMSLMFTFISSFAFRRSIWMSRRERVLGWVGTYYIHMLTMHAALSEGATLASSADCLVLARGGNPNDFNTVPGRFIALDARTTSRLIREIHGNRTEFWMAISQPFRRSYPARSLVYVAANGGLGYLNEACETLLRLGYSKTLLRGLQLLHRLKLLPVVKWLLDLRRRMLNKVKSQGSPK